MNLVRIMQQRHLRYFGHVSRIGSERYPYVALHGRIHGQRPIGRPSKRWIDNIKEDCTELGISLVDATHLAMDKTPYTIWAASPRLQRRQGIKSSKSSLRSVCTTQLLSSHFHHKNGDKNHLFSF